MVARVLVRRGRVAAAAELAREAVPLFRLAGQLHLGRLAASVAVEAAALGGDRAAVDAALAQLAEVDATELRAFEGELQRTRAAAARALGDDDGARRLLLAGADRGAATGERVTELLCLHDLVRLGDGTAVADRLTAVAGLVDGPLAAVLADHAQARVAGDAAGLVAAAERFEALGADPWALDALVAAAAGTVDEREAVALRRRAAALAARVEVRRPDEPESAAVPEGLSEREREVATLAAAGRSDREIAAELYLSVRTVGNHLLRVYRKLGIRTRDELGAALGPR